LHENYNSKNFEFYAHRGIPCTQLSQQSKAATKILVTSMPTLLVHKKSAVASYTLSGRMLSTTDVVLNFKRLRFFPLARPHNLGDTMFSTSLGCVSKFLNKGKSFTKKKQLFF